MKSSHILCLLLALVVGSIYLTYEMVKPPEIAGVSCASERVASYGYTDQRKPMAELAAIANWQRDAEKKNPGYGNWSLARKRSMSCQLYKNSAHIQCVVSANPCKFDPPSAG